MKVRLDTRKPDDADKIRIDHPTFGRILVDILTLKASRIDREQESEESAVPVGIPDDRKIVACSREASSLQVDLSRVGAAAYLVEDARRAIDAVLEARYQQGRTSKEGRFRITVEFIEAQP